MKKLQISRGLFFLVFFIASNVLQFSRLYCYVERDTGGIFDKIARSNGAGPEIVRVVFEPRGDRPPEDSLVFDIRGMEQFTKLVVKNSYSRLVILKLYSSVSPDSIKETSMFQSVADEFKHQAIFAGLNAIQNMDIVKQIAMFCRLEKIDLPLFLFYKDGQLMMPFLAGFQPQDALSSYIQNRFFVSGE